MKHKMKLYRPYRASCSRPGCMAGIETGMLGELDIEAVKQQFEQDDNACPHVSIPDRYREEIPVKERIEYLLKYAKDKIKSWEKLITYWEDL